MSLLIRVGSTVQRSAMRIAADRLGLFAHALFICGSMPKACTISWAMWGQPTRGLRRLNSTIASMSSCDGPFRAGAIS